MKSDAKSLRLLTCLIGLVLLPMPSPANAASEPIGYLSAPASGDPLEISMDYLAAHHEELGLSESDLRLAVVKDRYATRHNGVTHIYLQQQYRDLDVVNAILNVNVDREGRILNVGSRFVPGLIDSVETWTPTLAPGQAVAAVADRLGVRSGGWQPLKVLGGAAEEVRFAGGSLSADDIPVKLALFPTAGGSVRLAWDLVVRLPNGRHWYNLWVDATNGDLLGSHDWVGRLTPDGADYTVFPLPLMNPYEGERSSQESPADLAASPYGWHDVDGKPGAEYTDTRGNNLTASAAATGSRPDGGSNLHFDFPFDPSQPPESYTDAALVNLFYWTNTLHDIHYRYGFDEAAGNFQVNNYGNGGLGYDSVIASAQTDAMITFASPPDGSSPLMRMFIATPVTALLPMKHHVEVRATDSAWQGDDLPAAGALFGRVLSSEGVSGELVAADDASIGEVDHLGGPGALSRGSGTRGDACEQLVNSRAAEGAVVLVDDGDCAPGVKARHAQQAGAVGVILAQRTRGGKLENLGGHGTADDVTIPVVAVRASDAEKLRDRIAEGVTVTLKSNNSLTHRDSDFDTGVIAHEYGHGVANRLTGGPSAAGCLQALQSLGLVEGTGDFWALALTAKPADAPEDPRGISVYSFFQPPGGVGVRGVPYSTDQKVNDFNFGDLALFNAEDPMVPHAAGARWATILWEVYWSLVDAHGFDPDFVTGKGGNNLMLQLVMDGLKLQPCEPTFVEARDALLLADLASTGGANQCPLWEGFARRGLGEEALGGESANDLAVTASSKVPSFCS